MQTTSDVREYFDRVINMAKAVDVDLSTALDEGQIDVESYADMVTACCSCPQVGQCDRMLADLPTLDQAPEYCANKDTFARLRTA
jgi:hypothetical protein